MPPRRMVVDVRSKATTRSIGVHGNSRAACRRNRLIRSARAKHSSTKVALSQQVKEEHLLIVDAISRQDSEAARQAARQHMEGASRRLGSVDLKRFIAQNENLDSA